MKLTNLKSLLVAALALLSVAQLKAEERVVATVDGHPIMQSELKRALGKRSNTEANRKAALDDLINDFIVQREIQQSGIKINYAYVDQAIENIAHQNGITYGQLLDYLDSQHITLNQYRQQIAHQMLMEQIRHQSIGKSIQIEPQDVQALAKELMAKAKSDGKMKTVTGTQHRISHILLKITPILNDKQAKQKLTEITADIKSGKLTFEQAARTHSVDYASAAEGGDLGWNFLDIYDPAFAKIAKNSKKETISAPFKSQFGWHILKVTETRESDRTENAYMQKAYEQLVNKQAQEASKDWVKALRNRATIKYL